MPSGRGNFIRKTFPRPRCFPFTRSIFPPRKSTTPSIAFRRPRRSRTGTSSRRPRFASVLKAPQKITHWSKLRDCGDTIRYFCEVVSGLGERLGPVLFQLPPTFKKDADVLGAFLRELPSTIRPAFEFRHDSWFDDEIFDLLEIEQGRTLHRRHRRPGHAERADNGLGLSAPAPRRLHLRSTSNAGPTSRANKKSAGATSTSTSNTKTPASARSWPSK